MGSPELCQGSWKKRFLSLWICFHLFAALLAPNGENYLGLIAAPIFEPYLSFFEFTNQWSFFAPDPGPPPHYLEWDLYNEQNLKIGSGSLPEQPSPYFLRERENRRIALASFLLGQNAHVEKILVRKICLEQREVVAVDVWRKMYSTPSLQDVVEGKVIPISDSLFRREHVLRSFCNSFRKKE